MGYPRRRLAPRVLGRDGIPRRFVLLRLEGLLDPLEGAQHPLTIAVGRRNNISYTKFCAPLCDVYSYDSVTLDPVLLGSSR